MKPNQFLKIVALVAMVLSLFAAMPLAAMSPQSPAGSDGPVAQTYRERVDQVAIATFNIDGNDIHVYRGSEAGTAVYVPGWCFELDAQGKVKIDVIDIPFGNEKIREPRKLSVTLIRNPGGSAARIASKLREQGIMPDVRPAQVIPAELRYLKIEDQTKGIPEQYRFGKYEARNRADSRVELSMVMEKAAVQPFTKFVQDGGIKLLVTQHVTAEAVLSKASAFADFLQHISGERMAEIFGDAVSNRNAIVNGEPIAVTRNQREAIAQKLDAYLKVFVDQSNDSPFVADVTRWAEQFRDLVFSMETMELNEATLKLIMQNGWSPKDTEPSKMTKFLEEVETQRKNKTLSKDTWDNLRKTAEARSWNEIDGGFFSSDSSSGSSSRESETKNSGEKTRENETESSDSHKQEREGEFYVPKSLNISVFNQANVTKKIRQSISFEETRTVNKAFSTEVTSAQPGGWQVAGISVDLYFERAQAYLDWWNSPNKLSTMPPEPSIPVRSTPSDPKPILLNAPLTIYDLVSGVPTEKEKKPADVLYNVTVFLINPAGRSVSHTFNVRGMPSGRVETFGGLEFLVIGGKLYANLMPADLDGKYVPPSDVAKVQQPAK